MVKDVLPAGVKGIVTIGFICALVASLAAFFNSCATLFTEDFYKPLRPGKSEATYVMVGRIATVVVVILGMAWIPVMMSLGSLYDYLQGIQSLLAPAMVAVFFLGIFSKKITPKAGEWGYDCRIPYRYGTFGYQCNDQYGKRRNDRSFLGKIQLGSGKPTGWYSKFGCWCSSLYSCS